MMRWMRRFFPAGPEVCLQEALTEPPETVAIAVSTHSYQDFLPNVRVELKSTRNTTITFGRQGIEGRWDVWEDESWKSGRSGRAQAEFFGSLWLFTHLQLKEAFGPFKQTALMPVSGQTGATLQKESQGLEWLKTTFRVLDGALDRCRRDIEHVVVANFFFGDGKVWLRCFNLDISVVFREGGMMSVVVFDDKDLGPGTSGTPALEAEFATLKPAVLDEFIKISAKILGAAEQRYR